MGRVAGRFLRRRRRPRLAAKEGPSGGRSGASSASRECARTRARRSRAARKACKACRTGARPARAPRRPAEGLEARLPLRRAVQHFTDLSQGRLAPHKLQISVQPNEWQILAPTTAEAAGPAEVLVPAANWSRRIASASPRRRRPASSDRSAFFAHLAGKREEIRP